MHLVLVHTLWHWSPQISESILDVHCTWVRSLIIETPVSHEYQQMRYASYTTHYNLFKHLTDWMDEQAASSRIGIVTAYQHVR